MTITNDESAFFGDYNDIVLIAAYTEATQSNDELREEFGKGLFTTTTYQSGEMMLTAVQLSSPFST